MTHQIIRPEQERNAVRLVQSVYGQQYDVWRIQQSKEDVAAMLGEDREPVSVCQRLREADKQQTEQQRRKQKAQEQER